MGARDEITDLLTGFTKAIDNQDAAGVAGYYTMNARMLAPKVPMIEGRAGIEAFVQQLFDSGLRSLGLETVDVLEGDDLAVELGKFTMGFAPEGTRLGKYIAVYRRQSDGALKIVADTFNSDAPAT